MSVTISYEEVDIWLHSIAERERAWGFTNEDAAECGRIISYNYVGVFVEVTGEWRESLTGFERMEPAKRLYPWHTIAWIGEK